jgi:erythromycin esterase-like protein
MSERGEWNIGQLVREKYGNASLLLGFTTHTGTVTAASAWDAPAEKKQVRPALVGSHEELFHRTGLRNFFLDLRGDKDRLSNTFDRERLERAIGVIYLPKSERMSHYFHARLQEQFDVVVHLDETTALEPLERTAQWEAGEVAETYPFAV